MPFITRGAQPPFITPEGRPPLPIILIPQERPPPFDFESQPPPEFIAPGKQDSLPSDWYCPFFYFTIDTSDPICRYMRICGLAVEWLRRVTEPPENFPCESLEKYWSNRSEYVFDAEDRDPPPYQLISDRVGVSVYNVYSDWVQESREDVNEPYHTSHIAFPSPAEGFHLPSIGPVDESLSPVLSIDGQVPLLVPSQSTKPGDQGNVFTDIFRRTSKSIKSECFFSSPLFSGRGCRWVCSLGLILQHLNLTGWLYNFSPHPCITDTFIIVLDLFGICMLMKGTVPYL